MSDDDIAFTDEPEGTPSGGVPERAAGAERPREEDGAGSEGRDGGRPGSTGPTTIREDLGTLAEEGRRLYEAVETRFVTPLVRSYPEVARHLGAAGREIAAAFRTAVSGQEQAWRDRTGPGGADAQQEKITVERVDSDQEPPESGTTED